MKRLHFCSKGETLVEGYACIDGVDFTQFVWKDFYNDPTNVFSEVKKLVDTKPIYILITEEDKELAKVIANECIDNEISFKMVYMSYDSLIEDGTYEGYRALRGVDLDNDIYALRQLDISEDISKLVTEADILYLKDREEEAARLVAIAHYLIRNR